MGKLHFYSLTEKGKLTNIKSTKAHRARRLGATGSHSREEFLELIFRFDNFCPACGERYATSDLTEDHVVPLSCGGSDDISNIQPLCHSCNSRKRNKTKDYRINWVSSGEIPEGGLANARMSIKEAKSFKEV